MMQYDRRTHYRQFRRRIDLAALASWAGCGRLVAPVFFVLAGILGFLLIWLGDLEATVSFYFPVLKWHYMRIVSVVSALLAFLLVVIPYCWILQRSVRSKPLARIDVLYSAKYLQRYYLAIVLMIVLLLLYLPILTVHGLGWLALPLLPKVLIYCLGALVVSGGVIKRLRRRSFRMMSELEISVLPEYAPSPSVIYLASGFLSPLIDHIDTRMRLWKRVEQYLGLPSEELGQYREHGTCQDKRGAMLEFERKGQWDGIDGVRVGIARSVQLGGATPASRIGICSSATDASLTVLAGIGQWWEGKSIKLISTSEEYHSIEKTLDKFAQQPNVERCKIGLFKDGQWIGNKKVIELCKWYVDEQIGREGVCVVHLPHVLNKTGSILPITALMQQLQERAEDGKVICVFDGAHGLGQIPVDMKTLGTCIYLWSGHKWLFGPHGTGGMIFGNGIPDELIQIIADTRARQDPFVFSDHWERRTVSPDQEPQEWVSVDCARYVGLGAALDIHRVLWGAPDNPDLCWIQKAERIHALRRTMIERMEHYRREYDCSLRVVYQDDGGLRDTATGHIVASGMVLLDLDDVYQIEPETAAAMRLEIMRRAGRRQVIVSSVADDCYLRACVTPYVSPDQIDFAARVLCEETRNVCSGR